MNDSLDPLAWVARAEEDYALLRSSLRVRYPGDDPTPDEAREALEIAKAARRFSRKWLGLK